MKYFKESEFDCKCGNCTSQMAKVMMITIDEARGLAGIPFVINSGYRCRVHNKTVGGKPTSSHIKGLAVDIKATSSRLRSQIVNALLDVGITRIGIAKSFVHADVDLSKDKNVMWVY